MHERERWRGKEWSVSLHFSPSLTYKTTVCEMKRASVSLSIQHALSLSLTGERAGEMERARGDTRERKSHKFDSQSRGVAQSSAASSMGSAHICRKSHEKKDLVSNNNVV